MRLSIFLMLLSLSAANPSAFAEEERHSNPFIPMIDIESTGAGIANAGPQLGALIELNAGVSLPEAMGGPSQPVRFVWVTGKAVIDASGRMPYYDVEIIPMIAQDPASKMRSGITTGGIKFLPVRIAHDEALGLTSSDELHLMGLYVQSEFPLIGNQQKELEPLVTGFWKVAANVLGMTKYSYVENSESKDFLTLDMGVGSFEAGIGIHPSPAFSLRLTAIGMDGDFATMGLVSMAEVFHEVAAKLKTENGDLTAFGRLSNRYLSYHNPWTQSFYDIAQTQTISVGIRFAPAK